MLRIATSAFPMNADIGSNARWIRRHLREAANAGAHVVHFPECALAGYAPSDRPNYDGFDWDELLRHSEGVRALAAELSIAVVMGSIHRLDYRKPHNSVYIIGPDGALLDRYDKLFVAGPADDQEELAHYCSGSHFCTFTLQGVTCGVLICHDYRYPELYRQYSRRGVQVMFHSFHAGGIAPGPWESMHAGTGAENHGHHHGVGTLPGITMPATMISMAANNYVWISASNSSRPQSCWGSIMVRPDGVIVGKVPRNRSGLLITDVDPSVQHYDSTRAWRDRAIDGVFHSGAAIDDPRAKDRTSF
ncbi:MAG: carbon-nitrogen hydrolase family protein [Deltaproteobacteria bacterium]|nr:carbon-nitrogen hydrolase family protein [Deltaproteobacteria bacterium]